MENADILLKLNTINNNANTVVTVLGKFKMTLNTQCSRESSIRSQVLSQVCTQFTQSMTWISILTKSPNWNVLCYMYSYSTPICNLLVITN